MSERRLTVRLMQRWETMRNGKTIPEFDGFENDDLRDIWPYCFLVRLTNPMQKQLRCERMGEQIVAICGRNLTGLPINPHTEKFPDVVLMNHLEIVCEELVPVEGAGQFFGADDIPIRWRACFLPFGNAKGEVSHILVGFSFKKD